MGMEFRYAPEHQCIIARVKERFEIQEYVEVMSEITNSNAFPPNTPAIWDFSEMDFGHFDSSLVENIAAIRKNFESREMARIAFVVPDKLGYGMMRMIQVFTDIDSHSIVLFDLDQAIAWIKG